MHSHIADIVGDRSGEEMSVLGHHGDGSAEGFELDILDIDVIVVDGTAIERIEAGKKGNDGCLSSPGGSDKGGFLSGMGFKGDSFQNRLSFYIGEGDILESDFSLERSFLDGLVMVDDLPAIALAEVFLVADFEKSDFSFIDFLFFIKEGEDSFGTGGSDHEVVEMLREEVERLTGISCQDKIGLQLSECQRTGPSCAQCQDTRHGGDGEVEIAQRYKERNVDLGMEEGFLGGFSPFIVGLHELIEGFFFVVEGLDDFHAGDIFFDDRIDVGEGFLLLAEIFLAGFRVEVHKDEHDDDKADDNQGEIDIDEEESENRRDDLHGGEEDIREGIIQGVDDAIDIVGEIGHDFPVCVSVEVVDWKNLHLMHQFISDSKEHSLGDSDHDEIVEKGTKESDGADDDDGNKVADEFFETDLGGLVNALEDAIGDISSHPGDQGFCDTRIKSHKDD